MQDIEIKTIENYGDARGDLYNISDADLQFLDRIQNIHFGKIHPNFVRGNHYHRQTKEMLIVSYSDAWTLAWAKQDTARISTQEFIGSGAVLIKINKGVAHALKNSGDEDLTLIALSSKRFSRENADAFTRILIDPEDQK
jgi:dTDP-4-dehydrorhamnose 3,5-epimerase-like enzyme